jgi:hypothetical protein
MRAIAPFAVSIVYVVAVGVGIFMVAPDWVPWLCAALSAAYVWCYVVVARRRSMVALLIVFVVTLAFPISGLFAIGWPIYHSWSTMVASITASLREYGQLAGLELLVPLLAALLVAAFVKAPIPNAP